MAAAASMLNELGVQVVCVSDFQRRGVEAVLREAGQLGVDVRTIYNPIDDALKPDGSPVDQTKLVFFSSPNKGLAYTLDAFEALRRQMPEMRLCVGNPGYKNRRLRNVAGVEWLGALPHARILDEVRTALCVFYPNFVLHETFGLVLAEANAVGTPVITHDCGAASEVLGDARQVLPVTRAQRLHERLKHLVPTAFHDRLTRWSDARGAFLPYLERVAEWKAGARPQTHPDARFRLSTVADQWRAMFAGQPSFSSSSSSGSDSYSSALLGR
jgi:glycosyltransferase involved in cell wall biosynthesis